MCDRCGKKFTQEKAVSYSCILAEELQNEDSDEIVLLEDGQVDAGELAREAFILEMDTKTLCSEDCKGLCPPLWCRPESGILFLQKGSRSPSGGSCKAFGEQIKYK